MTVDDAQDARLDRLDQRVKALEELAFELRGVLKLAKPLLLLAGASLGLDLTQLL